MSKSKLMGLAALLVSGAALFQNGCLNGFARGFTQGFPAHNRFLSIWLDVANEAIFG
jgi:hypothetical protein